MVVTIVVLIILVTISINAVIGENGLINKAQQAKDVHRASSVEEAVSMWKMAKTLGKYTDGSGIQSRDDLVDQLVQDGLLTPEEGETVKETGSIIIADKTIDFGTDAKTLVDMFNSGELKIGDYVTYQNPTSGTYTAMGTKTGMQAAKDRGESVPNEELNQVYNVANNQLRWRVLGVEEGCLKLIAGSPMKKETTNNNPYLMMYGAQSYVTGVDELDKIAGLYKTDLAKEVRSINMDDVNAITGITTPEKIKEVNLDVIMNDGKQYGDAYSFSNHYTPESWINGKQEITVEGTVDGYFYAINAPSEDGMPSAQVTDTTLYNLLFKNVEFGQGACYWLASRGVIAYSGNARFGPGVVATAGGVAMAGVGGIVFYSDGREGDVGLAVRPVVILRSDVTAEQIQKIENPPEEPEWNYGGGGEAN